MMAPVFSRVAWRCVWHMIQVCKNVLVIYVTYVSECFNLSQFVTISLLPYCHSAEMSN